MLVRAVKLVSGNEFADPLAAKAKTARNILNDLIIETNSLIKSLSQITDGGTLQALYKFVEDFWGNAAGKRIKVNDWLAAIAKKGKQLKVFAEEPQRNYVMKVAPTATGVSMLVKMAEEFVRNITEVVSKIEQATSGDTIRLAYEAVYRYKNYAKDSFKMLQMIKNRGIDLGVSLK
jgi:hypothetical protein